MIGISDSVMSLGYKTSMAFNTSVNQKKQQNIVTLVLLTQMEVYLIDYLPKS